MSIDPLITLLTFGNSQLRSLKTYDSESSSSEFSEEVGAVAQLERNQIIFVNLATYSGKDLAKFDSCEHFADAVRSFTVKVQHWF